MNNSTVSIIVPVHNSEKTLYYCLSSLIDEELMGRYEIICVNNASTDSSWNILQEWRQKYPEVIKLYNTDVASPSNARNIGIEAAIFDWVYFCDSDDYIAQGGVNSILDFIEENLNIENLNMVSFNITHIGKNKVSLDKYEGSIKLLFCGSNYDFFLKRFFWAVWNVFYRRSYLIEKNIRFPLVCVSEDTIFNVQYLLSGEFNVAKIDANVYRYVRNDNSLTSTVINDKKQALQFINGHFDLYSQYRSIRNNMKGEYATRLKWIEVKNIPNLFAKIIHAPFSVKELREIRNRLISLDVLPLERGVAVERGIKFRSFLLMYPFLLFLFMKIYPYLSKISHI